MRRGEILKVAVPPWPMYNKQNLVWLDSQQATPAAKNEERVGESQGSSTPKKESKKSR